MSESAFTGLPPQTPRTPPPSASERLAFRARIVALEGVPDSRPARTTVEGEVVAVDKQDRTLRVRTDQGVVTLKINGGPLPPEGQKVQLDLPPGDLSRQQITIRVLAEAVTKNGLPPPGAPLPPAARVPSEAVSVSLSFPDTPSPPPLATKTALPVAGGAPLSPSLETGQIVRLLPLFPAEPAPVLSNLLAKETIVTIPPGAFAPETFLIPDFSKENTIIIPSSFSGRGVPNASLVSSFFPGSATFATETQSFLPSPFPTPTDQPLLQTSSLSRIDVPSFVLRDEKAAILPPGTPPSTLRSFLFDPAIGLSSSNRPVAEKQDALVIRHLPPDPLRALTGEGINAGVDTERLLLGRPTSWIARIIGATGDDLPLIALSGNPARKEAAFVLQFRAGNLPPGTRLELLPVSRPESAVSSQGPITSAVFPLLDLWAGQPWPIMEDLNQALLALDPPLASQFQHMIPNAAQPLRIPVTAFFFIAAVRAGDVSGWLGDKAVDALKKAGKGEWITRLSREGASITRTLSTDGPSTQEWRSMALPLVWNGDIHKILLHYHQDDRNQGENQETGPLTRFLFDLSLTRIGPVQLDGLHCPGRLDLIVRTLRPFSGGMKDAMHAAYTGALEQVGLSGSLAFQGKPQPWIKVQKPPPLAPGAFSA